MEYAIWTTPGRRRIAGRPASDHGQALPPEGHDQRDNDLHDKIVNGLQEPNAPWAPFERDLGCLERRPKAKPNERAKDDCVAEGRGADHARKDGDDPRIDQTED